MSNFFLCSPLDFKMSLKSKFQFANHYHKWNFICVASNSDLIVVKQLRQHEPSLLLYSWMFLMTNKIFSVLLKNGTELYFTRFLTGILSSKSYPCKVCGKCHVRTPHIQLSQLLKFKNYLKIAMNCCFPVPWFHMNLRVVRKCIKTVYISSKQCTEYSVHLWNTLYRKQCTVYTYSIQCREISIQCTFIVYSVQNTA